MIRKRRGRVLLLTLFAAGTLSWLAAFQEDRAPEWLRGTTEQKFAQVEDHLRGMDVAMRELNYRYSEVYFAAQDRNWAYAQYQTEKMEQVMRLGLERRPRRAASAQPFMAKDLPRLLQAVQARDWDDFQQAFQQLRQGCNDCHMKEQLPTFTVQMPESRDSSIRLGAGSRE